MINIVYGPESNRQAVHIINRCKNIINNDMLRNQFINSAANCIFKLVSGCAGFQNLIENRKANTFIYAAFLFRIKIDKFPDIDHPIRKDFDFFLIDCHTDTGNPCIIHFMGKLHADNSACFSHQLSCRRIHHGLAQSLADDTTGKI